MGTPPCRFSRIAFRMRTPSHIRLFLAAMFTFPPIGVIGLLGLTNRCPPSGLQFIINETAATLSRGGDDYESVVRCTAGPAKAQERAAFRRNPRR